MNKFNKLSITLLWTATILVLITVILGDTIPKAINYIIYTSIVLTFIGYLYNSAKRK